MDPNSSLGKICLGENVVEISSDKVEGSGDWNSPEFQDTANNGQKKKTKAMVFHQMDTKEVSDKFVALCFVNGLEAYDGEINLGVEENMISNEYAVKLCLEHKVKIENKVVKKELIVALRGEIYFVKFIINPEEDDVEPGVILERTFLCMTKAITDFEDGTVTIYLEFDPFLEDIEEEEKSLDYWDHLLYFNLDDIPLLGEEELLPFLYKIGKSNHNVELDGKIVKEKEEAIKRIKGKALKEKDNPGAFIFPIRLEGKVNENALADTGSDINTMSYRIYKTLRREKTKKVDRGITMINHTQAKAIGMLTNVLCQVGVTTIFAKFLILDIPIDHDTPIVDTKLLMEAIEKRNKAELETISLDDLYNNLKIYEPEISGLSDTNQNPQNMAFVSSKSIRSTNEADTTASGISTAHTQELQGIKTTESYQVEEETPINYAFMALTSSGSSSSSDFENLEKVEKERDELKPTLEKLQNSSKSLNTLLNSQVSDKSKAGLGYKELIPETFVNTSDPLEKQNNRSTKGYHEVPPPLTRNYMTPPPKHDLRLIDEHFESESVDVSTVLSSADKTVDITHKKLGKVREMMGSSVRVVEWAGKEGEWGYGAWREKRFGVNSNPFKTGGKMILFGFWGFCKRSKSCEKCLHLDTEFFKSKQEHNDLLKKYSQLEKHCISLEVSMQLKQEVFQNDESCVYQNALQIPEYLEKNDLKAQLKDKDTTICKLKDTIKSLRKNNKEEIVYHDRCDLATINEELQNRMFKLDLEPLAPKLVHSRESHSYYLKHTQEQADILQGIVEQAKTQQPLDNALDFSCNHAKRILELLVYVKDTCPSVVKLSETNVARTPMNKIKKVTFSKPIVSSSTNQETHDPNKPMLHSIGVKCSTSASGSKHSGNTKNNRISQPSSSKKINKVEDQHRSIKTRKNNKNQVKQVKMFTSTNVVPPKQTTSHSVEIQKPEIKVYHRKPKNVKNTGSSKIAKIVESKNANHSEPYHTWGSIATDIPSSSSLVMTCCPDFTLVSGLWMFETHDRESLTAHEPCIDLLSGSRDTYLYTISLDDMLKSSPICIISKASKTKSWLWHRRLSHLNLVQNVRTYNGTEFVNQTLREFYENVGISHQTSVARTPQQNDVVEWQNQTLVEATRTMLIFSKDPLFLWAEAINTACYTQNHIGIFVGYAPAKKAFKIYNRRTRIISETIHVTFDELTAVAFEQFSSGPGLLMTPATPEAAAPRAEVLADSLVSVFISQDAPSTSLPLSQE
uniref:Integrase catalytic domain-containing protein n=1 Tax=Tanacetum cinerariifolium TaxID=118510 RepID=A0A6L2J0K9_TANCI|nr:hypothetical protein [Tanacetum cinerariifolium]